MSGPRAVCDPSTAFLPLLVSSRIGASAANMAYAGSIPFLIQSWSMTAAQAGSIQSAFNMSYALSLLACSVAADRLGARRIFVIANWSSAAAFLACVLFARSYETALPLFAILALTLGGSYTPALMLVSERVPASRRGSAVGWVLAGSSIGYFVAIAFCTSLVGTIGYQRCWLLLASLPLLSALAGTLAVRGGPSTSSMASKQSSQPGFLITVLQRDSVLLTAGYTAHCWELLGMWAWAPAFLTLALAGEGAQLPLVLGITIAACLHLSGALATLIGGAASDRWGRRSVLVAMAAAGAVLSFAFGWSSSLGPAPMLLIAFAYGFATIGDSGVLTAAMTEAVPPGLLGRALAMRSIVGFGAGAISPVAFGWILDITSESGSAPGWGWAFAALGVGGLMATFCALLLRPRGAAR